MPQPTKITLSKLANGPIAAIEFDDGRVVSFMPAYGSGPRSGDPVSIGQLKIEDTEEQPIAKFFSPYQYPICYRNMAPDQPDYGFQALLQPYMTLDEIVDYLTKAATFVGEAYAEKPRRYAEHAKIVHLANNEISQIRNGEYPLPSA